MGVIGGVRGVALGVDDDVMNVAVVEGVPEVGNASGGLGRHLPAGIVGSEVEQVGRALGVGGDVAAGDVMVTDRDHVRSAGGEGLDHLEEGVHDGFVLVIGTIEVVIISVRDITDVDNGAEFVVIEAIEHRFDSTLCVLEAEVADDSHAG